MYSSPTIAFLLGTSAWAQAWELTTNHTGDVKHSFDMIFDNQADELFDRLLRTSHLHHADLDKATLEKSGNSAAARPTRTSLGSALRHQPSTHPLPHGRSTPGFTLGFMAPHLTLGADKRGQVLTMGKKRNKGGLGGKPPMPTKKQQQEKMDSVARKYMFTISRLSKVLPNSERNILKDINLAFFPGAKIGIVGLNAAGKSTLLKIMAGVDKQFDGTAVPMPGASIGYLAQEPELPGDTVVDNVNLATEKAQKILDEFNEVSGKLGEVSDDDEMNKLLEKMTALQTKIDAGDLWELDRFKERAMDSLRCPPPTAEVTVLSGGERRRVALAKLILENHDMILLDEPTNHLDAQSVAWLEKYLNDFKGTVVAITHDRYFLENSCQWILELDRGEGIPFEGSYSDWLEAKSKRLALEKRQDEALQKTLANELEWVRKTPSARGTKSKARLKRYDELLNAPAREGVAQSATIYIPPGPRLGDVVIDAKNVNKAYGDKLLMKDMTFSIPRGAVVGVIGPNGAGKTTLMKMMLGEEKPDSGEFIVGDTVKLAYVDQSREGLDPKRSVFEEMTGGGEVVGLGKVEVSSRAYCSWFGFRSGDQQKPVEVLSGGERNRVQLGKTLRSGANVIIFDEPTNDLDVNTIRSLEEAILEFAGCAIVVSHDRYFLDRIATHILAFEGDSVVKFFEGNFQEYDEYSRKELGLTDGPKPIKFAKLA